MEAVARDMTVRLTLFYLVWGKDKAFHQAALVVDLSQPRRMGAMTIRMDERINIRPRKPPSRMVGVEGIRTRMGRDVSKAVTMISTDPDMEDKAMMREGHLTDLADQMLTAQEDRIAMVLGGKKASDVLPTLVEPKALDMGETKSTALAGVRAMGLEGRKPMVQVDMVVDPGGRRLAPQKATTPVKKSGSAMTMTTVTSSVQVVTEAEIPMAHVPASVNLPRRPPIKRLIIRRKIPSAAHAGVGVRAGLVPHSRPKHRLAMGGVNIALIRPARESTGTKAVTRSGLEVSMVRSEASIVEVGSTGLRKHNVRGTGKANTVGGIGGVETEVGPIVKRERNNQDDTVAIRTAHRSSNVQRSPPASVVTSEGMVPNALSRDVVRERVTEPPSTVPLSMKRRRRRKRRNMEAAQMIRMTQALSMAVASNRTTTASPPQVQVTVKEVTALRVDMAATGAETRPMGPNDSSLGMIQKMRRSVAVIRSTVTMTE